MGWDHSGARQIFQCPGGYAKIPPAKENVGAILGYSLMEYSQILWINRELCSCRVKIRAPTENINWKIIQFYIIGF